MRLLIKSELPILGRLITTGGFRGGAGEDPAVSTEAIGNRYETINAGLDGVSKLIQHLGVIERLIDDVRRPVSEEFELRRTEHGELVSLRVAHEGVQRLLAETEARERDLVSRLAAAETALAAAEGSNASKSMLLEENRLELDQLREQTAQSDLKISSLESSQRDALTRAAQLDEDCAAMREQAEVSDRCRAEAEAVAASAKQEAALVIEESVVLRQRLDDAVAEAGRLERVQMELESQLTGERARAHADQAEASRTLRSLEGQLDLARSEMAGLRARAETASLRANRLEDLNAQLSQKLADISARCQVIERNEGDLQVSLQRAADRIGELEANADLLRQKQASLESARAAAVNRADQLTKTLQAHEKALKRDEENATQLRAQFDALQSAHKASLRDQDERVKELEAQIAKLEAEVSVSAGALQSARSDRARIQQAMLGVRALPSV